MNHRVKLKDIANITSGSNAPKDNDFSDTGLPFVRAGHLESLMDGLSINNLPKVNDVTSKKLKLKKAPRNSILFAKSGMSCKKNRVYKTTDESFIVNHLACITPKSNDVNVDYLKYFLQWFKPSKLIRDESYPSIRLTDISNIELAIPELSTQNKIAKALNLAVKVIKIRQQQIEALSALKQSIFLDMFGDPLEKELKTVPFEDVIIDLKYGTSTPPVFSEQGYKFIRATNIKFGQITEENMMFINKEEANKVEKCKLESGDLIFVRSGVNAGDNAIVTEEYVGHYGAYDIIVKPNQKVANPYYLNALFNSHYLSLIIKPVTRRAGQPHINAKQIKSLKIFIPSINLQNQYEIKVRKIIRQINILNESQEKFKLLYDSILHKAFNGELFKEEDLQVV